MSFARHGSGVVADGRALLSQVHPVFMLPPIAASWFGSVLAGEFDVALGVLHGTAIFLAVYTAHVKDGYVDFYVRDEDDDHPLSELGCRLALGLSSAGFLACLVALWRTVGPVAAAVTLPTWLIAYHHAPQLDTNPLTATTGYPLGIAIAIVGGYYVQAGSFAAVPLAFAVVFLVLLSGIKVVDDAQDYEYDRSIEKETVAVVLGRERARTVAFGLMAVGLLAVLGFVAGGVFPLSAALAVLVFLPVAAVARRGTDELATMLLVRGSYLFLAVLLVAVYYEPLS
ncbi:UbiA family prenyltransferase [Haloarchaeobius sp. HRN-SO-5]|uniref:UbiA family prenyltransferase n=1 Tax=Haloarchaeobius sp. HRN-SO-5 TaxID=3446118 RepID=UPI003EB97A6C